MQRRLGDDRHRAERLGTSYEQQRSLTVQGYQSYNLFMGAYQGSEPGIFSMRVRVFRRLTDLRDPDTQHPLPWIEPRAIE